MVRVLVDAVFALIPVAVAVSLFRTARQYRKHNYYYAGAAALLLPIEKLADRAVRMLAPDWYAEMLLPWRMFGAAVLAAALTAFVIFIYLDELQERWRRSDKAAAGDIPPMSEEDMERAEALARLAELVPDERKRTGAVLHMALRPDRYSAGVLEPLSGQSAAVSYAVLAIEAMERGLHEDSWAWAQKALSIDPDSVAAFLCLGYYHFRRDELDEAGRMLSKVVELDPDASSGWVGLAMVRSHQGRRAEARDSYRRAFALSKVSWRTKLQAFESAPPLGNWSAVILGFGALWLAQGLTLASYGSPIFPFDARMVFVPPAVAALLLWAPFHFWYGRRWVGYVVVALAAALVPLALLWPTAA